jgi:hypothetical protein
MRRSLVTRNGPRQALEQFNMRIFEIISSVEPLNERFASFLVEYSKREMGAITVGLGLEDTECCRPKKINKHLRGRAPQGSVNPVAGRGLWCYTRCYGAISKRNAGADGDQGPPQLAELRAPEGEYTGPSQVGAENGGVSGGDRWIHDRRASGAEQYGPRRDGDDRGRWRRTA